MVLFTSSLKAELEKATSRHGILEVLPILELELPTGTLRMCSSGVAYGGASPFIKRWNASPVFGVSVGNYDLQGTSCSVTIACPTDEREPLRLFWDNAFAKYHNGLRRTRAVIGLVCPSLLQADTATWFVGVLQSWSRTGPFEWTLNLSMDDLPLKNGFVARVPITKNVYPAAHESAIGQFWPVIYGVHDSSTLTAKGMVECLNLDTSAFLYGIGLGKLNVLDVYKTVAGITTALVLTTDYIVIYQTNGGTLATTVDLVVNPGADAVITADVEGFTYASDGTGGVITSPTDQLAHMLANFIYNDWRQGPFYEEIAGPADAEFFGIVGAFLSQQGHEGAVEYRGDNETRATGEIALNEWLSTHGVSARWTHDGHLALFVLDHDRRVLYSDSAWLKVDSQGGSPLTIDYNVDIVREVNVSYILSSALGNYMQSLAVVDTSVVEQVPKDIQMPWSAAHG